MLGAKVQLKLNTPAEAAELLELRGLLSDKNTPTRDVNGFRKLLLALTGTGDAGREAQQRHRLGSASDLARDFCAQLSGPLL